MPDISMCQNEKCPLKDNCYRYKAEPNPYRQSYGEFEYKGDCEYYIPIIHKK